MTSLRRQFPTAKSVFSELIRSMRLNGTARFGVDWFGLDRMRWSWRNGCSMVGRADQPFMLSTPLFRVRRASAILATCEAHPSHRAMSAASATSHVTSDRKTKLHSHSTALVPAVEAATPCDRSAGRVLYDVDFALPAAAIRRLARLCRARLARRMQAVDVEAASRLYDPAPRPVPRSSSLTIKINNQIN